MIVPASEFQKNFGHFKEVAQREPVTVTSNGRESVVLISVTEFARLSRLHEQDARSGDQAYTQAVEESMQEHRDVLDGLSQ